MMKLRLKIKKKLHTIFFGYDLDTQRHHLCHIILPANDHVTIIDLRESFRSGVERFAYCQLNCDDEVFTDPINIKLLFSAK